MEFGSSMEITSDGHISCYIGADGGIGTYSLSGNILSADIGFMNMATKNILER